MKRQIITLTTLLIFAASAAYSQTQIHDGKQTSVLQAQAPLSASDDEWHVAITPYAWVPGVDLDIKAPVSVRGHQTTADLSMNADWTKVLSHYGPGFRILSADGRIEVSKGKWGGFIDGYWMYIKVTGGGSGAKLGREDRHDVAYDANFTNKTQFAQINFGPRYLIGSRPLNQAGDAAVGLEVYGGGRVNYLSNSLSASATINNQSGNIDVSSSRAFAEPMIGLKTIWKFGPNFMESFGATSVGSIWWRITPTAI
jgi:hypothetical protein